MDLPINDKDLDTIVKALALGGDARLYHLLREVKQVIIALLLFLVGWGLYLTAGEGKNELKDPIKEHAKMHELGIAHKHDK